MELKKITSKKASAIPAGVALGALASMCITLISCMVISFLVAGEKIGEGAIGTGAIITLVLSAAAGALTAALKVKHSRLIVCMISGCAYYLCLLCCTAVFFGGQYRGMGAAALAVLGGCLIAALPALKNGNISKKSFKKYRVR